MGTISKHFSYREFEKTDHAQYQIENIIRTAAVRDSICALVTKVLEPLREAYGQALTINSGYRCPALNKEVGGAATSQHVKGEAADVKAENPYALAKTALLLGLPFDQMILYPTFVHFSHKLKGRQRRQLLYNKSYKGQRL